MGGHVDVSVGDRFGDLVVVRLLTRRNGQRRVKVQCQCGRLDELYLADLRAGRSDRCHACAAALRATVCARRRAHKLTVRCPGCGHCFHVDEGAQ